MTTIGIIGSGQVGSSLAKAAVAHGYEAVISNSKGPQTLAGLVAELGPEARAAAATEAAAAGDFAIVAIPLTAVPQVPAEPLAGKVVISTINYIPQLTDASRSSTTGRPRWRPRRAISRSWRSP